MRREEWVTVQGPVKMQQPDGMSHRGGRVCIYHTNTIIFSLASSSAYEPWYGVVLQLGPSTSTVHTGKRAKDPAVPPGLVIPPLTADVSIYRG